MVRQTIRPYVTTRQKGGRIYYYFRRAGTYARLPYNPDSPEFDAAYWKYRSGKTKAPSRTTFDALITSYLATPAFLRLATSTRKEYRRTLDLIREKNGAKDFTALRRRDVIAARDTYAATWRKAWVHWARSKAIWLLKVLLWVRLLKEWASRIQTSCTTLVQHSRNSCKTSWMLLAKTN